MTRPQDMTDAEREAMRAKLDRAIAAFVEEAQRLECCEECDGSGDDPDFGSEACGRCNGAGVVPLGMNAQIDAALELEEKNRQQALELEKIDHARLRGYIADALAALYRCLSTEPRKDATRDELCEAHRIVRRVAEREGVPTVGPW